MKSNETQLGDFNAKKVLGRIVLIVVLLAFFINTTLFVSWITLPNNSSQSEVYFSDNFDHINRSKLNWDIVDGEFIDNALKLSSKKYLAPHAQYNIESDKTPPGSFVLHFRIKIASFTNEAITLCSLVFPTKPIVIVANQDGAVGVSSDIFSNPNYSKKLKGNLKKNEWQDIYISIDDIKHTLEIYVNNIKIFSEVYEDLTYPLKDIYLGCIWIKGGGSYGTPLNVQYDNVTIGSKEILPKPSLLDYLINYYNSLVK